jgi:hypothetical protein
LPIASSVSCVPNMLDFGNRGILLTNSIDKDVEQIEIVLKDETLYATKIKEAISWSRNFTIDKFENEIKKLLSS